MTSPKDRGDDGPWRDAIDPNPMLGQYNGPDFAHMDHCSLGPTIQWTGTLSDHSGDAAVIDDAAPALLFHDRYGVFDAEETRGEVGFKEGVEIFHSEFFSYYWNRFCKT